MNYQNKLNELINSLSEVPHLLLHSCCGPCSTQVINYLTKHFDITVLFYNPNIEPKEEYEKRKKEQVKFLKKYNSVNQLNFIDCDYENDKYREIVKGLELLPEGSRRCEKCFDLRLEKTAQIAVSNNYDFFGTTLTVSPHKNSKVINELCEKISIKYNIKYIYGDFKKNEGYKKSIEFSKKYDLYRQEYCGCMFSKKED